MISDPFLKYASPDKIIIKGIVLVSRKLKSDLPEHGLYSSIRTESKVS